MKITNCLPKPTELTLGHLEQGTVFLFTTQPSYDCDAAQYYGPYIVVRTTKAIDCPSSKTCCVSLTDGEFRRFDNAHPVRTVNAELIIS